MSAAPPASPAPPLLAAMRFSGSWRDYQQWTDDGQPASFSLGVTAYCISDLPLGDDDSAKKSRVAFEDCGTS